MLSKEQYEAILQFHLDHLYDPNILELKGDGTYEIKPNTRKLYTEFLQSLGLTEIDAPLDDIVNECLEQLPVLTRTFTVLWYNNAIYGYRELQEFINKEKPKIVN